MKDTIVFASTPDYADNARVLCDFMRNDNRFQGYRFIWIVGTDKAAHEVQTAGMQAIKIRYRTYGPIAMFAAARSKLVFFTHRLFPSSYIPHQGQVIANLWHGCGYKHVSPTKLAFSFALVPGELFIDVKAKSFSCDRSKILPLGYPRYDRMVSPNTKAHEVKYRLQIPNSAKVVLWLPTFRKHVFGAYDEGSVEGELGLPLLRSEGELMSLDKECAESNICLVIKRHPSQVAYSIEKQASMLQNIRFITQDDLVGQHIDLYELFAASDALVSDYSSAAVDYLLLDRPIGFVLDDFAKYEEARGFCLPDIKQYMPGKHIYTLNNLVDFLNQVARNEDRFATERARVASIAQNPCSNYCERVTQIVIDALKKSDEDTSK